MANERERLEAEVELLRVQAKVALWQQPLMSNDEVPVALGIGRTSWHLIKREGPPCVYVGGRPFYRTDELLQWINALAAKKNPGITGVVEGGRCD